MAEKRMFAKQIIDSDAFLDMPLSTQTLYFHLSMRADDDGFINNPKKIQRMIGASEDDLKVLIGKRFIIPFESGIVVIKHWRIHNYIQKDRYKPTAYTEERSQLKLKDNGVYTLDTDCIQDVSDMETQNRLDKIRLDKSREDKKSTRFAPPSVTEVNAYINEKGYQVDADAFVNFYVSNGWMVGKNKMKDWKAAIRTWERRDNKKPAKVKTAPSASMSHNYTAEQMAELRKRAKE